MADAVYKIKFTMSDGSVKEVQFTAPQGPQGDGQQPIYCNQGVGYFLTILNRAYNNGNPAASYLFKLRYVGREGASITFRGSGGDGTPTTINPGEEIVIMMRQGVASFGCIHYVNGVCTEQPKTYSGTISLTLPSSANTYSFIELESNVDLSQWIP